VRDVLVAGRVVKREGRLLRGDLDAIRDRLATSSERILGRLDIANFSRRITGSARA
jgi:hypothetical protein